jgi:isopenicillin-N epimerase
MDLENWMWKTHKIRIRGGDPNKLRLSTPYYLQRKEIDRFLEKFDEYKREKKLTENERAKTDGGSRIL